MRIYNLWISATFWLPILRSLRACWLLWCISLVNEAYLLRKTWIAFRWLSVAGRLLTCINQIRGWNWSVCDLPVVRNTGDCGCCHKLLPPPSPENCAISNGNDVFNTSRGSYSRQGADQLNISRNGERIKFSSELRLGQNNCERCCEIFRITIVIIMDRSLSDEKIYKDSNRR